MKIGIIGGGASGLFAAINAKNDNNEVIIFERNQECGKKILATGNGRCNYWNSDQDLLHYESSDNLLISELVNDNVDQKVLSYFDSLGIIPNIKNGYYYPFSNQAKTIRNILYKECLNKNITIKNNTLITNIIVNNNNFVLESDGEKFTVDKLIIATGSCASPVTGSDGMGYKFLENFGHTIVKPLPSLVQLESEGSFLKKWDGVRSSVKASLYVSNNFVREEEGEIQLTKYGVSGICIFNLSNKASRALDNKKEVFININFLPFVDDEYNWFINTTKKLNKNIKNILSGILNDTLVDVIINNSKVDCNKLFTELNDKEQEELLDSCFRFRVNIKGTKGFNSAQVCSGGVKLSEINLSTMESKIVKNLYVTGELLDLTGDCGGYNLGIAFRSGLVAGLSAGDNND